MPGLGFSSETFTFYERLGADNSRAFWQANKDEYRRAVRDPMEALLAELDEFGPFHIFRPNKDVRFSKDKRPYKDHIGAYGESDGGAGFYVQMSAAGMFAGSGYHDMAKDQLDRFRRAVDAEATGTRLAAITDEVVARGLKIGALAELKTAPRGYPKDHPRIELLRRKGLIASREWSAAAWMGTTVVVKRIGDTWRAAEEMNAWLDAHVGPTTIAPDENELERLGRR